MKPKTAELWGKQDQHQGDRWRLFSAVAGSVDATTVLYPGSYVDIAPSVDDLHASGRGIGYTKSPFAYLFEWLS